MSQVHHVRHESHSPSPGYPAPYPPSPAPPPPPGYPRPDRLPHGYQGYFHGGYPSSSATPPPLRPYHQYHDNDGIGCSSVLRGCLAALYCYCILDECCF